MGLLAFSAATLTASAAQAVARPSTANTYQDQIVAAKGLRAQGKYAACASTFRSAAETAALQRDWAQESSASLGESGCDLRVFRYREALAAAGEALELANRVGDHTRAGAAAGNKAAVYYELGDWALAADAAEQAARLLHDTAHKDYLGRALLLEGDALGKLGQTQASKAKFDEAIASAHAAGLTETEAMARDHLGEQLLRTGDLSGAGDQLQTAQKLWLAAGNQSELPITQAHIAEWDYKMGDYAGALRLIRAVMSSRSVDLSYIPRYWCLQFAGNVLLAMGRLHEALSEFAEGVHQADEWRLDTPLGDSTRIQTVVCLSSVYQDYVDLAARLAVQEHNSTLARSALQILTESRAASLRDQLTASLGRRLDLPPHYYELLDTLQKLEAEVTLSRNASEKQTAQAQLQRIRLELADLENKIGIKSQTISSEAENDRHRTLLSDIQLRLRGEEVLLSFSLGSSRSFLWTVTRTQVNLYELPAQQEIATEARAFASAVQRHGASQAAGNALSRMLFGRVPASVTRRPAYLIAADGALLDGVPFSALPDPNAASQPLAAAHSIRFLPSEALLNSPHLSASEAEFVGIADPIYNRADPRLAQTSGLFRSLHDELFLNVRASESPAHLARLVSSEREVRTAANVAGMPAVSILTGSDASRRNVQSALAKQPAIIHFAVHVVSPEAGSDQAALTLSLGADGMPELLTRESIAALRVPGSLVVLSGCASQQGAVLPSAGVVGLGRAWLLAGASAVLVTSWPTPDDSGAFFSAFYRSFRTQTGTVGERAAAALRQAQQEMRAGSGFRSDPSFWSAYSLTTKE